MTGQGDREIAGLGGGRSVHRRPMPHAAQRAHAARALRTLVRSVLLAGFLSAGVASGQGTAGAPSEVPPLRSAPSSSEQEQPASSVETRPTLSSEPSASARPGVLPRAEGVVETVHESVSHGILATATWLDSFFGNERHEAESNESQFRVFFDAFREGNAGMDYRKPDYSMRLVLPQLRKKTRLEISGDPTVDATAIASPTPPVVAEPQPEPATTRHVATSLQYFPIESDRSNFSIRAGVKLNNSKVSILLGPRYRYLIPLDSWTMRLTQEVTWSSDKRWQSRSTVDLERTLSGGLFFRTSLDGLWTENVKGYPYALGFTLLQPLDRDRALQYSWINSFQTRPNQELVQELFAAGYRQRFWKPWLFFEIDPQVRYPRDRHFHYTPGILFRIEMVFGKAAPLR